ncbi:Sc3 protein [Armillaria gallica]|uniref:Hydrophobin n=1 Tax=Armillaria gallica TaxID=47427 RepID=A0A2H3D4S9_ARMGA|nr:Sc3 protein [Armillaria gallica]
MFSRIPFTALLALPLLATAIHVLPRGGGEGVACATGTVQCCDDTQSPTELTAPVSTLLGTLGVVIGQLTGNVGVSCVPITVIGVGGTQCSSSNEVDCCSDNNYNGLVSLGCSPLDIGL